MPQRPRTQPPTRRLNDVFRLGVTVDSVEPLSADIADAASAARCRPATVARNFRGECSEDFGGSRSAVTVLVEMMGDGEKSSGVGDMMRRGVRMGKLD